MATKLSELMDLCEADLADSSNATFAEADIMQWCIDAIADYTQHFQRELDVDLVTSLNDRTYDLPTIVMGVVSVEYPQGEDPPKYLQPRGHTHPDFWIVAGYYDHIVSGNDTDADEIWISEKPAASETIRVRYRAHHDLPTADTDELTVPDEHQYILRNYVLWRAALQLKALEEASPTSNSSLIMSQLAINSDRMRRAYVDSLAKALYAVSRSKPVSWKGQTEESSRIY
jgi:hypothetical protein